MMKDVESQKALKGSSERRLQSERRHVSFDEDATASLNPILTTQLSRYIHISAWGILLLCLVSPKVVSIWYGFTILAGFARSLVEKRMGADASKATTTRSSRYAFVAMCSSSFWAAAPILAWTSGAVFGEAAAVFFIANGYMLAFAQFRSSPLNALIATSPYAFVFLYCLWTVVGTPLFWPLLAALPMLVASISYVLMFGSLSRQEIMAADKDRAELIEELKAARIVAERASDAKSMFLANMSHEIRTPMNGVLGMAEMLAKTELDNRQRTFANTIHQSGTALLTIINDVLDFSKIEAGKLEVEELSFDLHASVGDVAALMAARAQEKELELHVSFEENLPSDFVGDAGRIRQVITNLVSNAVKFTEQGHVAINVSGVADHDYATIRIEIEDTGIGIDPANISHVFEEFQQADSSTTRKYGGTGLGLTICRRLVEAMGGKIGVVSEVGVGSTFWFEIGLPVIMTEKPALGQKQMLDAGKLAMPPSSQKMNPDHSSMTLGQTSSKISILVAEDNEINQMVIKHMLDSTRFDLVIANNGREALNLFEKQVSGFDAVLMDVSMPEMDGHEATMAIRELESKEQRDRTPIICLTAHVMANDVARAQEVGMDDYLSKPISQEKLYNVLGRWVRDVGEPKSLSA